MGQTKKAQTEIASKRPRPVPLLPVSAPRKGLSSAVFKGGIVIFEQTSAVLMFLGHSLRKFHSVSHRRRKNILDVLPVELLKKFMFLFNCL